MTLQKNKCATSFVTYKNFLSNCFLIIPLSLVDLAVAKNWEKRSVSVQEEDSNIVADDKSELV